MSKTTMMVRMERCACDGDEVRNTTDRGQGWQRRCAYTVEERRCVPTTGVSRVRTIYARVRIGEQRAAVSAAAAALVIPTDVGGARATGHLETRRAGCTYRRHAPSPPPSGGGGGGKEHLAREMERQRSYARRSEGEREKKTTQETSVFITHTRARGPETTLRSRWRAELVGT